MRVLILSCNTGGGHNSAGRAMEERLKREGEQVTMLDIMSLAGQRTSKIVGKPTSMWPNIRQGCFMPLTARETLSAQPDTSRRFIMPMR